MLFICEMVKPAFDWQGYWAAVIGALVMLSTLNGTGLAMII